MLNDIAVWSTLKKLFPFASKGVRSIWDQYQHDVFGVQSGNEPIWFSCTATVNSMVPVAIEVLRGVARRKIGDATAEFNYLEEIFALIKAALIGRINDVVWISAELSKFLMDRLEQTQLQVGVPAEVLRDDGFLDRYYAELFPQIVFIENFEYLWTFQKTLMAKELGEFEEIDE